jgi:predicted transporter
MLILGLVAALFLLSIKTGLVLGSSWLTLPGISGYAGLFGSSVVFLSYLFNGKYELIGQFIDRYTFAFACLSGLLFLYLGTEHTSETEIQGKKQKLSYWLSFLPCPFCVGALVVTVIYTAGGLKLPLLYVAVFTGILFAFGIILMSWVLRKLLNRFNFSIVGFFHQGLLFLGVFTLLSAFLIPNIVATMQDTFVPVVLCSQREFLFSAGGFLVLFMLGLAKEILTCSNVYMRRR